VAGLLPGPALGLTADGLSFAEAESERAAGRGEVEVLGGAR
jgi:hypothetical protein